MLGRDLAAVRPGWMADGCLLKRCGCGRFNAAVVWNPRRVQSLVVNRGMMLGARGG